MVRRTTHNKIHLSGKNEDILIKFETYLKSQGKRNKDTLRSYTTSVRIVLHLINKDYYQITKDDIINAFASDKYADSSLEIFNKISISFSNLLIREL